jgi:hypothetical protein
VVSIFIGMCMVVVVTTTVNLYMHCNEIYLRK